MSTPLHWMCRPPLSKNPMKLNRRKEELSELELGRRQFLAWSAAGCAFATAPSLSYANKLLYPLSASPIAEDTWAVYGLPEYFSLENGGNIVNVAFIDVGDGIVVVDTGTSKRYGESLVELIQSTIPGKPIIRVYNTHHHPDHVFGNQAFDANIIATTPEITAALARDAVAFSDNLYRLLGDWMRGTETVLPTVLLESDSESIGNRTFSFTPLSGHTEADLIIRDDKTGVVFGGDLAFLSRAPTTPSANLPSWHDALNQIESMDRSMILPGHGPVDLDGESVTETRNYLTWVEASLREAVGEGLTMNEAMAIDIPEEFSQLYVVRTEFERSVVHLYRRFEDEILQETEVTR